MQCRRSSSIARACVAKPGYTRSGHSLSRGGLDMAAASRAALCHGASACRRLLFVFKSTVDSDPRTPGSTCVLPRLSPSDGPHYLQFALCVGRLHRSIFSASARGIWRL